MLPLEEGGTRLIYIRGVGRPDQQNQREFIEFGRGIRYE